MSCGDLSAEQVCGHNALFHCVYIPFLSRKSMYVSTGRLPCRDLTKYLHLGGSIIGAYSVYMTRPGKCAHVLPHTHTHRFSIEIEIP